MHEILSKVAHEAAERWYISNTKFKEPIICGTKAIELRLRGWSAFSKLAYKANKELRLCKKYDHWNFC